MKRRDEKEGQRAIDSEAGVRCPVLIRGDVVNQLSTAFSEHHIEAGCPLDWTRASEQDELLTFANEVADGVAKDAAERAAATLDEWHAVEGHDRLTTLLLERLTLIETECTQAAKAVARELWLLEAADDESALRHVEVTMPRLAREQQTPKRWADRIATPRQRNALAGSAFITAASALVIRSPCSRT